jgi:hypothetical protein
VAAVAGIGVAIKAGSDLNEQLNKSEVVFGKASSAVIDFSETTASSLGIAQSEALEAAGNFGTMFDAAGFAGQAAAEMSVEMVKLSADLGSFNNIPVAEALEKIRAGLAGEAEPLRQLGVFLSEARVETEAYTSGIAKQGAELTDAQKIQARYNIIMRDTAKAQGDFARTVGTSLPNQLKVLTAELTDTAATLGTHLLPVALDVVKVIKDLAPVVGIAAKNLGLLLGIALGWGALKFLPALLFNIALGLEAIGAGSIASGLGNVAGGLSAIAGTAAGLGAVAVAAGAVYLAIKILNDEPPTFAEDLGVALADLARDDLPTLSDGLAQMRAKANMAEAGITSFNGAVEAARRHAIKTGDALSKMGKDIRDGIVGELPAIIGTVTTWKDTFTLSPGELVKISASWARIARTIARDLREIAHADLTPSMREAISALPPEMRDAWVRGNAQQRGAIQKSIKDAYNIQDTIKKLAGDALTGGSEIGRALDTGTISGIAAGSNAVAAAARNVVQRAIDAAKAAAGVASPSKRMHELGQDMIRGLIEGLEREAQKAVDAATSVLQRVMDAASSFRGAISGGIAGFGQLSGAFGTAEAPPTPASIGAFAASQAGAASQFAAALDALRRQGASKGLLTQVAGGGAEALPFAQALLQGGPALIQDVNESLKTIAGLAGDTAERLTRSFFGQKIDALKEQVVNEKNILQRIEQELRFLDNRPNIHIVVNGDVSGQELVDKVERELLNKLQRGGAILNGAVRQ